MLGVGFRGRSNNWLLSLSTTSDRPVAWLAAVEGAHAWITNIDENILMIQMEKAECTGLRAMIMIFYGNWHFFHSRNVFQRRAGFFWGATSITNQRSSSKIGIVEALECLNPGSERRYSSKKASLRPHINNPVRLKPTLVSMCTYCFSTLQKLPSENILLFLTKYLDNW